MKQVFFTLLMLNLGCLLWFGRLEKDMHSGQLEPANVQQEKHVRINWLQPPKYP
jgi:hypothetical protein